MKNSKKLWLMLALALVLMCWASCAGADEGWCSNCGLVIEQTVVDMGTYHEVTCTNCGYTYQENHEGLCTDFVCHRCGSTNNEGAYIGHYWDFAKDSGDGIHHYYKCNYCGLINEGTHTVFCDENSCGTCYSTNVDGVERSHAYSIVDLEDGLHHQSMCGGCGETSGEPSEHRVWCTNPGVCTLCYASNVVGIEMEHYNTECVDQGDGTHQFECVTCGEKIGEAWAHYASCVDGYCYECGSYDVEIFHDYAYVDTGDGQTHKEICEACGEEFGEYYHARECWEDVSGCSRCGYSEAIYIYHWETYVDQGDGKTHLEICQSCGETLNEYTHTVMCTEPGECEVCGSTNVADAKLSHLTSSCEYIDLGTQHQMVCNDCGYKWDAENHWAYCNEPTTCRYCKLTGLTVPSDQYTHRGTFTDIGTSHKYECYYCDYTEVDMHWVRCTDQSKCYGCGATGFEITWENRYCQGPITYLSHDDTNHTFSCGACGETYTEPHSIHDDGSCGCGYEKEETTTRLPGDADDSKGITLNDAYAILNGTASNTSNADVNADGKVDVYDALLILQYLAGWNVTLK